MNSNTKKNSFSAKVGWFLTVYCFFSINISHKNDKKVKISAWLAWFVVVGTLHGTNQYFVCLWEILTVAEYIPVSYLSVLKHSWEPYTQGS